MAKFEKKVQYDIVGVLDRNSAGEQKIYVCEKDNTREIDVKDLLEEIDGYEVKITAYNTLEG